MKCWKIDAAGMAACLSATGLAFLFAFLPIIDSYQDVLAKEGQLRGQQEQSARLDAALGSLQARVNAARRSLADSPLRLEPATSINHQLAEISSLASESGLRIDDIRPDRPATGTYYDSVPISVAGSGTYRTCTVFLDRLRKTLPDTSVSGLELTGNPSNPLDAGRFRFDMVWHAAPRTATATP